MESGTQQDLTGVAGTASDDIFAVGRYGTILHYDGQAWQPMESGTLSDVFAVWAAAPTDVFAGCADGTILHYDGDTWTDMGNLQQRPLYAVWGSSGEDVYAVGYGTGPIGQTGGHPTFRRCEVVAPVFKRLRYAVRDMG